MNNIKEITKELSDIAIPLIIQSVLGLVIGLTDQAMVGRISLFAYGAVGVVYGLLYMLAGVLGHISVMFNINGGKSMGKGDIEDFYDEFISSLIINISIGCTFFFAVLLFKKPILIMLYGFEGSLLDEAIKYTNIMSVYILIQLLLFNFGAIFKIHKKTKWILIGSFTASILNLIIDYVLIFGKFGFPRMGVRSAAISTIAALSVNLAIYILLCREHLTHFKWRNTHVYVVKIHAYIKNSIPLMAQEILEGSIFVVAINAVVARIGVVELSAYLILVQLINILLMPMYMYGSAALTLISRSHGKGNKNDLMIMQKISIFISMSLYILIAMIFLAFRIHLPAIISNDTQVVSLASVLLVFMIGSHIFDTPSTVYKYSFQALGHGKFVLFETAKVNLAILLLLVFLVYVVGAGIYGVFCCLFLNYLILSIIYKLKYDKLMHVY